MILLCVFSSRAGHTSRRARNLRTPKSAGGKGACQEEKFLEGDPERARGEESKTPKGREFSLPRRRARA